MAHTTGHFTTSDGHSLHYNAWGAHGASPGRTAVILIHGLGEHGALYDETARFLVERVGPVYAPDLRGHGLSPGRRGHIRRWGDFRRDLHGMLGVVRTAESGAPLLLGHSLGGLLALDFAVENPDSVAGIVALAPPLGRVGVPGWLLVLGSLASSVWPSLTLKTGFDLSGLTRDPARLARIIEDPLFHRRASARLATEVFTAVKQLRTHAARLQAPVLLLHGTADRMTDPAGTRSFFDLLSGSNATLREYEGAYHHLLEDSNREQVMEDIAAWIGGLRSQD